jgi:hypothetical protein
MNDRLLIFQGSFRHEPSVGLPPSGTPLSKTTHPQSAPQNFTVLSDFFGHLCKACEFLRFVLDRVPMLRLQPDIIHVRAPAHTENMKGDTWMDARKPSLF